MKFHVLYSTNNENDTKRNFFGFLLHNEGGRLHWIMTVLKTVFILRCIVGRNSWAKEIFTKKGKEIFEKLVIETQMKRVIYVRTTQMMWQQILIPDPFTSVLEDYQFYSIGGINTKPKVLKTPKNEFEILLFGFDFYICWSHCNWKLFEPFRTIMNK